MIIVKNRKMVVPYDDMYIGTTYDDDSERRIFRIDRYAQNERDLSALTFRLDIKQPGQQADTVILDKDIDERYIYLIWNITNSVLRAVGLMFVQIRAIDSEATVKWSTYDAALYVARHLNTPGSYTGSLTEIEQMEQDFEYMKGVVDELKANIDYAHDAEAWAKGTRSGSAVPSTDPTYHNNSKYYSDQASTKATQAANSATAAANSATQAAETVSDTNTRFNNAVAAVTVNTEVQDARVGADGTTYTVLKNRLDAEHTNLKSQLEEIINHDYDVSMFEVGGISSGNGVDFEDSTRLRTQMFNQNILRITAETGYSFLVYAYSGNTFVGTWNGSSFNPTATSFSTDFVIDLSLNYNYRIAVKRSDNANISLSEAQNIIFARLTDVTLTKPYKAADAKVTGDAIDRLHTGLVSISTDNLIAEYKISDISTFISGKGINSSGVIINANGSYCTEYYIPLGSKTKVWSSLKLTASASYYHYVAFYDSTLTFISRSGGERIAEVDADIPTNAKYCRISLSYVGTGNVSAYQFFNYYPLPELYGSGKVKWYVFGDSISAGYYSITDEEAAERGVTISYRPDASTGVTGVGSVYDTSLEHNYWGYANKWMLHKELVGKAQPAQGYLHSGASNGISMVKNTDVSDAALITVAWGFNDWHYNMTRGDHTLIDASVPYPGENYDTTQITTVNQAIWFCLGELIRKAPQARIIVQTPMNGWLYGGDFASNWGIGYAMSNSGKLSDIHDDIVYWANYYGLQILDMTYNNSAVNRMNIKTALLDGSHPSDPTHMQLGRYVATYIGYN